MHPAPHTGCKPPVGSSAPGFQIVNYVAGGLIAEPRIGSMALLNSVLEQLHHRDQWNAGGRRVINSFVGEPGEWSPQRDQHRADGYHLQRGDRPEDRKSVV